MADVYDVVGMVIQRPYDCPAGPARVFSTLWTNASEEQREVEVQKLITLLVELAIKIGESDLDKGTVRNLRRACITLTTVGILCVSTGDKTLRGIAKLVTGDVWRLLAEKLNPQTMQRILGLTPDILSTASRFTQ